MKVPLFIRLLPDKPVFGAATLWGLGRLGRAPGTLGALAGLVWFTVMSHQIGEIGTLVVTAFLLPMAIWMCGEAEWRMHEEDPGCVILDEAVVMPVCFVGLSAALDGGRPWMILLAGFALFRLFDILKPPPIRQLQRLHGGLGIVADDFAAAIASCICLHLLVWWKPDWFLAPL